MKKWMLSLTPVAGGSLTFAGLSVDLDFGVAISRSGGERNYLERVYQRPRYMATCVLAAQIVLLSFSSRNALGFGRYVLFALGNKSPTAGRRTVPASPASPSPSGCTPR